MSGVVLAVDTSNYTTSAALCGDGLRIIKTASRLLPVEKGHLGLRQSEAVFHHTRALPEILSTLLCDNGLSIKAVAVSKRPRDEEGSYMPCFLAGNSVAESIGAALHVPVYGFSHQAGHIAAALYGAGRLELLKQKFIAFHLSGGTTEGVLVTPDEQNVFCTKLISKTLDLNAGQAVDRVGALLGLDFPAGIELEKLAKTAICEDGKGQRDLSDSDLKKCLKGVKPCLKGNNCCLSGVVNRCEQLLKEGGKKEYAAYLCLEYIAKTLEKMTEAVLNETGDLPVVYSGGVMSNQIIKQKITSKYGERAVFSPPEFSRDNAAGTAILGGFKYGL